MKFSAGIRKCPKPKNSLFMKLWDFEPRRKKEVDRNQKKENWAENRGEIKKTKRDQTEERQNKNEKIFRGHGRRRQTRVKKQRAEKQREEGGPQRRRGKQGAEKCCAQAVWPGTTRLMKQQRLLSTQPCCAYVRAPVDVYAGPPRSWRRESVCRAPRGSAEQSDDSPSVFFLPFADETNEAALMQTDSEPD